LYKFQNIVLSNQLII